MIYNLTQEDERDQLYQVHLLLLQSLCLLAPTLVQLHTTSSNHVTYHLSHHSSREHERGGEEHGEADCLELAFASQLENEVEQGVEVKKAFSI